MENKDFDVIIIGGSYAGLSAGMALGRSLRNTLIIDDGKPCNIQTPQSHNFLTHDGTTPAEISSVAKEQVLKYDTIQFYDGLVTGIIKDAGRFEVETKHGENFSARKIILATGIKDIKPDIPGFEECWGISVLHCPYCHGYEVRDEVTGVLATGDVAYEFTKLIHHWTKKLTLFTNGPSEMTAEQQQKFREKNITIVEDRIKAIHHENGYIQELIFKNGKKVPLKALYSKINIEQNLDVSGIIACELAEHGVVKIDSAHKTSVDGIFACGDSVTLMRSVATAIAHGNMTGAIVNKELIEEDF